MLGGKKAPKVIRAPDATKQGPEVEFKNTVANIRGSIASGKRVDNPKLNMKRGKRAARLHDRDPVIEHPVVDKKARGEKRKRSSQADNLYALNTTNYSEVSHFGKASKTWCDLVCSQRVTSVTLNCNTGILNKRSVQITKSWDHKGRCTTCASQHSVLEGDAVYIMVSDQHAPAILPGGPVCVGSFRVLNLGIADISRFILEPALDTIRTEQNLDILDFGLISIIQECVNAEKLLVLGITSGTGEYLEGPLAYNAGMDRILRWTNSRSLKVMRRKGKEPGTCIKIVFPAPATPYMETEVYSGPATAESIKAQMTDMRREATGWARTLAIENSSHFAESLLPSCINENMYTRHLECVEPMMLSLRENTTFHYLHGLTDYTPVEIFTPQQPSQFTLGSSKIIVPHKARSHVSKTGGRALRPGYLAEYARSLIPALLVAGESEHKGVQLTTRDMLLQRANNPNILMSEDEWMQFVFTAGDIPDDPLFLCVHRGSHKDAKEYKCMKSLTNHLQLCFPSMPTLEQGKCALGKPDFPKERGAGGGDANKKARKS
jgi:hypothetical protein